jgi:hypothetical protein
LKIIPFCRRLIHEREQELVPPGHFYSTIPNLDDVKARDKELFESFPKEIPGIDLNESEQLALLDELGKYSAEVPFEDERKPDLRYFFKGDVTGFSYPGALALYAMIRYLAPKKIIEVGCGKSSCVMLDTNEFFLDNKATCTFIDPYPGKLLSLIKKNDLDKHELISKKIQEVELEKFRTLSAGDILFIDSSHISKVGSDVNYIFFEVLPCLNSGVYIHFHDIFYPFEYLREWVYEGRFLNENYMLRTFLQYNSKFKIVLFGDFLQHFYSEQIAQKMPLHMKRKRAGYIWLRKD